MTDPTPNGQTGELICPLATCFGCPDPGRCDALRRGDQPAPSQRDPELAAALNEQRRQSYNAETLRTRPAPSSDERAPFADLTDEEFAVFAEGAGFDPGLPSSDTPSDERRWCALCGTWEDEADWITHSGHASLFPTDDVRHADAVTAEPEWSTRPVPSSDTPSDERCPVCGAPVHPQPPFRYAAPSSSPVAEASGRPDPLHLPKARAVIEWWLADEFGSLDAAVEGVLWTGPEEPREQVEQVLDALRQVLKTQEFEDD